MRITITTDYLSGATVDLVVAHIEAVKVDRGGINSPSAYAVHMASGKVWPVRKGDGERVLTALDGAEKPHDH